VVEVTRQAKVEPPMDLMMSSGQVCALREAGMVIGAHTVSHPILARLERAAAASEIGRGKQMLESLLGEPVTLFAYPNGRPGEDFTDEHAVLAREAGFDAAVTTAWGAASAATDRYGLPRFTPWDTGRLRFGLRLIGNLKRH
jgi:peptidoglycan/xylan/chitin deacetylase (PgdA/CDA1 family)